MGITDAATDDNGDTSKDGCHQQEWQGNEQLIKEIKYFHKYALFFYRTKLIKIWYTSTILFRF